jgi:hypothetical protein
MGTPGVLLMSALPYIAKVVIPAAYSMLPFQMRAPESRAMIIAICLQESRFEHRRQIGGPARGFPQFELAGIRGVLNHHATRPHILKVLQELQYDDSPETSYAAIEHNDTLAMAYSRLNLWWHPDKLPGPGEVDRAWNYYIETWRPGKPHEHTWDAFYSRAWAELQKV